MHGYRYDQKYKKYVDLIEQLMWDQSQIDIDLLLRDNRCLLDDDLARVMSTEIYELKKREANTAAKKLSDIKKKAFEVRLSYEGVAGAWTPERDSTDTVKFLFETMLIIEKSEGKNSEIVQSFIQQNSHLLSLISLSEAKFVTKEILSRVSDQHRRHAAAALSTLAAEICQFPFGSKRTNVEIGIAISQEIRHLCPRDSALEEWMQATQSLAVAYLSA